MKRTMVVTINSMRKIAIACFLFACFRLLTNWEPIMAKEQRAVLYISSYNEGSMVAQEEIEGIREVLSKNNILLDTEFMDVKRLDRTSNIGLFSLLLGYKLKQLPKYDAIILGDDEALQFAISNREVFFLKSPCFF